MFILALLATAVVVFLFLALSALTSGIGIVLVIAAFVITGPVGGFFALIGFG